MEISIRAKPTFVSFKTDRLHNERVSCPVAYGITHRSYVSIRAMRPAIGRNRSKGAVRVHVWTSVVSAIKENNQTGLLNDKARHSHSRDARWQTTVLGRIVV